jgi:uncharacterized membrane protein
MMTHGRSPGASRDLLVRRATAIASLLGVVLWLGGLLALGAIAAPVVFSTVAMPASADAMSVVFRRFDAVATSCAAVVLASEAARVLARVPFGPVDHVRAGASAVAGSLALFVAASVSPRIAALHAAGVARGLGDAGAKLARLHDTAELCGTIQVALLVAVVVAQVIALTRPRV